MTYRSSYELDLEIGFALLEQVETEQGAVHFESDPDEDRFMNMLLAGVHGGGVDPDSAQQFVVYSIDWPEELADDFDEEIEEGLSSELDSLFPGWVVDPERDKVYVLRDPDSPEAGRIVQ